MNKYKFRHRDVYKKDYFLEFLNKLVKKGFKIKCASLPDYKPMKRTYQEINL